MAIGVAGCGCRGVAGGAARRGRRRRRRRRRRRSALSRLALTARPSTRPGRGAGRGEPERSVNPVRDDSVCTACWALASGVSRDRPATRNDIAEHATPQGTAMHTNAGCRRRRGAGPVDQRRVFSSLLPII
jgi:hypothetical protein